MAGGSAKTHKWKLPTSALATIIYVFTSSIPTASAMTLSLLNLFTNWLLLCVKVPIFGNICSHHMWRDCIMRALHVTIFMVCMFSSCGNYPQSVPLIEAPALKVPIIILWLWSLHTAYLHCEGFAFSCKEIRVRHVCLVVEMSH